MGRVVGGRQVERERAPLPDRALGVDLAAEQAGDLPADGQPETGAAEAPGGGAVGLLEGLEDEAQLVLRHADAGVGHGERDHLGRLLQRVVQEAGALGSGADRQPDLSALGELEGVGQQVAEHLLEALLVGEQGRGHAGRHLGGEREGLLLRYR